MLREEEIGRLVREALREEAESIVLPPPEVVWARVSSRLSSRPPRRRLLPTLVACGLAAAVLALVLMGPLGAGRGVAPPQVALGPDSAATARSAPSVLTDRLPPEAAESAAPPEKEETRAQGEKPSPPAPAAETPESQGQAPPPEGTAGEEPAPAVAEAEHRLRAGSLPSARNHQPERRAPVPLTPEEARQQLPFPLPILAELPAGLTLSDLTVESREQQTVATLVYRDGESFLYLRVSNGPLEGALEPAETVTLDRAVGVMSRQADRVRLRWEENQLYLEIETNLEPDQLLAVANSIRWGP